MNMLRKNSGKTIHGFRGSLSGKAGKNFHVIIFSLAKVLTDLCFFVLVCS